MELTIQDKTYKFVFGWKFLKEINADNKRVQDGMTRRNASLFLFD